MEQVEKRTLMRTVFSKIKAYFRNRQGKYRLKLRSNVHLRLNRSKKLFFALFVNLTQSRRVREMLVRANEFLNRRLKYKTLFGFKQNVDGLVKTRKMSFKALCFFKHSNMYRVFLNWKLLPSFNYNSQVKKQKAETQFLKNLKKRIFILLKSAKICSQLAYLKKIEMLQKTK